MEEQSEPQAPTQPSPKGGFWKIQAVIFEPRSAFEEIRRNPTFALPLLLAIAVAVLGFSLLLYLVGPDLFAELIIEMDPQSREQQISDEQLEFLSRALPYQFYGIAVIGPLIGVFAGAGIYWILMMLFGAEATYKQTVSVVAHSSLIFFLISSLLSATVLMITDDYSELNIQSPATTNLGFLFDRFEEPAMYALAAAVDLTAFYYLFLAALGLTVITRRKSMGLGIATVVIPYVILVGIQVGMAYIFS